MATVVLRTAIWLILLAGATLLALWKPLVLLGLGVAIAAILILSKFLGDLLWNDDVHPDATTADLSRKA